MGDMDLENGSADLLVLMPVSIRWNNKKNKQAWYEFMGRARGLNREERDQGNCLELQAEMEDKERTKEMNLTSCCRADDMKMRRTQSQIKHRCPAVTTEERGWNNRGEDRDTFITKSTYILNVLFETEWDTGGAWDEIKWTTLTLFWLWNIKYICNILWLHTCVLHHFLVILNKCQL